MKNPLLSGVICFMIGFILNQIIEHYNLDLLTKCLCYLTMILLIIIINLISYIRENDKENGK